MEENISNISILVIEDEGLIAQDISDKLEDLGYDVAGVIANSEKAVDFLSYRTPDLVLCDICIKGPRDGIEVAELVGRKKKIPFVFLTSLSDRATLDRAKKVLPYGYIVKPFNDRDLLSAIEIALYKHSIEIDRLALTKEKIDGIAISPLTVREYELLIDITKGLNNDQICAKEFISLNTVKSHIRNILAKLEATNRATAMHRIIDLLSA